MTEPRPLCIVCGCRIRTADRTVFVVTPAINGEPADSVYLCSFDHLARYAGAQQRTPPAVQSLN